MCHSMGQEDVGLGISDTDHSKARLGEFAVITTADRSIWALSLKQNEDGKFVR
jgi:hypothetical protein